MGEIDWQCDDGICEHTDRVAGKCACYNKETRFAVAEEGFYKSYVVDTKLDITVAGPFRYGEEAVYEARMLERDAMEAEDEQILR